jgi:hypothetical protein
LVFKLETNALIKHRKIMILIKTCKKGLQKYYFKFFLIYKNFRTFFKDSSTCSSRSRFCSHRRRSVSNFQAGGSWWLPASVSSLSPVLIFLLRQRRPVAPPRGGGWPPMARLTPGDGGAGAGGAAQSPWSRRLLAATHCTGTPERCGVEAIKYEESYEMDTKKKA